MSRKKIYKILGQYGAALVGTWWYWVSTIWYCLELSGTGLIWGFNACIYCRKKMEIWSGVTIAGQTNEQTTKQKTRKEGATQPLDHGRLR